MRTPLVRDLADCTEFRQSLQARPPRVVHGTVLLLALLLGSATAWAALTQADLVVRAPGRVRPLTTPLKVVNAVNGEVLSATSGGRVLEVHFRIGDRVKQGEVLLRLDTERLDADVARRQRTIHAAEDEVAQLNRLAELSAQQFEAARARAEAELKQARAELRLAEERRTADIVRARLELQAAIHEEEQARTLVAHRATARDDLVHAQTRRRLAAQDVVKAEIPVDAGKVEVSRQALEQVARDYALKSGELEMKRKGKQAEVETARLELAALGLERRQAVFAAPIDGVIVAGDVKVGDVLERGKPVLEIAALQGFCFEVAVPSEEVGRLSVGMPVRVKLDAYDYQKYGSLAGTVSFIAPDSGLPEGQRTAVYLVKIRVEGEELRRGDLRGPVKLGMAGQAEILTGQDRILSLLLKKVRQSISLG
jgi:HlyD family secretion protein